MQIAFSIERRSVWFNCVSIKRTCKADTSGMSFGNKLITCRNIYRPHWVQQVITFFCKQLEAEGHPKLRIALCIGGLPVKDTLDVMRQGCHIMVATPGRLMDMLNKKMFNLGVCRYNNLVIVIFYCGINFFYFYSQIFMLR